MKRTLKQIKKEIKNRGVMPHDSKDIVLWAILFAIEDLKRLVKES